MFVSTVLGMIIGDSGIISNEATGGIWDLERALGGVTPHPNPSPLL